MFAVLKKSNSKLRKTGCMLGVFINTPLICSLARAFTNDTHNSCFSMYFPERTKYSFATGKKKKAESKLPYYGKQ